MQNKTKFLLAFLLSISSNNITNTMETAATAETNDLGRRIIAAVADTEVANKACDAATEAYLNVMGEQEAITASLPTTFRDMHTLSARLSDVAHRSLLAHKAYDNAFEALKAANDKEARLRREAELRTLLEITAAARRK